MKTPIEEYMATLSLDKLIALCAPDSTESVPDEFNVATHIIWAEADKELYRRGFSNRYWFLNLVGVESAEWAKGEDGAWWRTITFEDGETRTVPRDPMFSSRIDPLIAYANERELLGRFNLKVGVFYFGANELEDKIGN